MATASVTHALSNGTTADASQVATNFTDLVNFLNASTVHKDGAIAMTGALSLVGSDPTTANHATRKSYVDVRDTKAWSRMFNSSVQSGFPAIAAFDTWYYQSTPYTITNPSNGALNIFAWGSVNGQGLNGESVLAGTVAISVDGGSTYTTNDTPDKTYGNGTNGLGWWSVHPNFAKMNATPTGDIKVKFGIYQYASLVTKGTVDNYNLNMLVAGAAL